ncbi:hypothetical protein [Saccharicrinis sp. FJH54]|uniref:hypothetical protein n=1 Tax=Saccharicrinis sp. FJH54 TaxID=3344665 RepID=UPI0035D4F3E5
MVNVERHGISPEIFSGKIYIPDLNVTKGSPYLFENGFRKGIIYMGQMGFEDVLINIDITRQLLIIETGEKSSYSKIIIPHQKVDSFFVDGTKFIWSDKIENGRGYLKRVSTGKLSLYIITKNRRVIDQQQQSFKYTKKQNGWYLQKDDAIKKVNSRKKMIKFLSEQNMDVQKSYVKKHVILWRWYENSAKIELVRYLNSMDHK